MADRVCARWSSPSWDGTDRCARPKHSGAAPLSHKRPRCSFGDEAVVYKHQYGGPNNVGVAPRDWSDQSEGDCGLSTEKWLLQTHRRSFEGAGHRAEDLGWNSGPDSGRVTGCRQGAGTGDRAALGAAGRKPVWVRFPPLAPGFRSEAEIRLWWTSPFARTNRCSW